MTDASSSTWQRRALYAWIASTTIYYYSQFTLAFVQANRSAITSLLDRLF